MIVAYADNYKAAGCPVAVLIDLLLRTDQFYRREAEVINLCQSYYVYEPVAISPPSPGLEESVYESLAIILRAVPSSGLKLAEGFMYVAALLWVGTGLHANNEGQKILGLGVAAAGMGFFALGGALKKGNQTETEELLSNLVDRTMN